MEELAEINKKHMAVFLSIMGCLLLVAGGFFLYSSAIASILISVVLVIRLINKKELVFEKSLYFISLLVLCLGYITACFWAVDRGMAAMGAIKYIPVPLFYLYLCQTDNPRKVYIDILPFLGAVMSIIAFILYGIKPLRLFFSVSGRLSGTFQYPNTFAAFLLICLFVSVHNITRSKLYLISTILMLPAIFFSGSKAVMILLIPGIIGLYSMHLSKKKGIRFATIFAFVVILIAIVSVVIILNILTAKTSSTLSLSTFYGRFLYMKDALPLLIRYPLGMGYYGYFFVQDSIQTGNYAVVNVHNDILQFMLDAGVLPGILFLVAYIEACFSKKTSGLNRLLLLIILPHIMFDFDMQYISFFFILGLFMPEGKKRIIKMNPVRLSVAGIVLSCNLVVSVIFGLSELFDYFGLYNKALDVWYYNTNAQLHEMNVSNDISLTKNYALQILDRNEYVDEAYNALATYEFYEGDVGLFDAYQTKAIEMAPYHTQYYLDYVDIMSYSAEEFITVGDFDSAKVCLECMETIETKLGEISQKSSPIAYKLDPIPVSELPEEYKNKIIDIQDKIN